MRSLFTYLLDTLFPPHAETLLVRRLTPEDVIRLSAPQTKNGVTTLAPFSSPVIRALIHETKFKGNMRSAELLAHLLTTHIETRDTLRDAIYIPIPLSKERYRERGYNQVTRILEAMCKKKPDRTVNDTLLVRKRHTRPQTELTRKERLANMDDAFSCPHPEAVEGKHIVVIDDVSTTGATLRASENALLPHHPREVILIALAH